MNIRKNIAALLALLLLAPALASAQQADKRDPEVTFNPHWFIQAQGGAGYTIGEAKVKDLFSGAAAVSFGYRFTPVVGLRFGVDGWQGRGYLPEVSKLYKYDYLQGNAQVVIDISNWWGGYRHDRFFEAYIFAGVGLNGAFRNNEATALYNAGYAGMMEYYWRKNQIGVAGQAGIGADLRVSNHVAINIEINGGLLSDRFNSKKAGNVDWQLNGLVGLTFSLGKTHKRAAKPAPAPEPAPAPAPKPQPKPEPKPEPAPAPAPAPRVTTVTENVFFELNRTEIRASETGKIDAVAAFLRDNPDATVAVCGYADRDTGNANINSRLSKERAEHVAEALEARGISADRITVDYKGDTVQPFGTPEENRVAIVVADIAD